MSISKPRNASILRRLQYFEAAARLGSVARAAEELGVSSSAISHHIADLRRTVGEDLFVRSGRGIVLTQAGELLSRRLSTAFDILDSSVTTAIGGTRSILQIAVCSAFGPFWLMPRLSDFRNSRPEIELEVRLYSKDPELTHSSADCIVTARDVKPGYNFVELFEERVIAVAAPGLVRGRRLDGVPLVTTDTSADALGADWRAFSDVSGMTLPATVEWVRCSHYILALEAAKSGLGAALVPDFVAASFIDEGRLEEFGAASFGPGGRTYRACFKESRKDEPALRSLVSWLKCQLPKERQPCAKDTANAASRPGLGHLD